MHTLLYLSKGWHSRTKSSVDIVILTLELALEVRALLLPLQTRKQAKSLQTGKECECEELHFRRGSPLACGIMGITCSSYHKYLYFNDLPPIPPAANLESQIAQCVSVNSQIWSE